MNYGLWCNPLLEKKESKSVLFRRTFKPCLLSIIHDLLSLNKSDAYNTWNNRIGNETYLPRSY